MSTQTTIMLIAHEVFSFLLFWSVFCRSAHVHGERTKMSVRISLLILGGAAMAAMGAPFYGWQPDAITFVLLASFVVMQITSAELWRNGVPEQFRNTLMP